MNLVHLGHLVVQNIPGQLDEKFFVAGALEIDKQSKIDLSNHHEWYKFMVEAAAVAVLGYVAFTDFRTFKIHNSSVLLLLVLYGLYALIARSRHEVLSDIILGAIMFGALFWFYTKGVVGGGDVKLVPVVCLWVGAHCALVFSIFLLIFIFIHLIAVRMGWARTIAVGDHPAISYAPSVAVALICTIALGCL